MVYYAKSSNAFAILPCISRFEETCFMENNLNLYHIFYTVAKNKNISLAAKELYISQPAISKAK